ncbi:transcription activator MSS11-like [Solanum dulcamara]|uniref:transcription activator MSS11-like n=1 Tax=Solanum dulcamara TaxID=45834 RepID=UPI0024867895|nr:transcription activator MSS11-like [Solanum dulcamara]
MDSIEVRIMDSWNSQKMLDKCIYDYFVKKGMCETAEAFAREVDVGNPTGDGSKCINDNFVKKGMHEIAEAFTSNADIKNPTNDAIESPEVFLTEWWDVFHDVFNLNQAAQHPYAEAARTMDNVVPQVPYAVPASSSHSATPAHNISPAVPAFSPERSQEQRHLRTPEDEVTSKLRFVEMDRLGQRAPFVTDSSCLMEEIPNMPQQWEAKNEGEGRGTMQMEPNADTPKKGSSSSARSF